MAETGINIVKRRIGSDICMLLTMRGKSGAVLEWSSLRPLAALLYSKEQRMTAGRWRIGTPSEETPTKLPMVYHAEYNPEYTGIQELILTYRFEGRCYTVSAPVVEFVCRSEDDSDLAPDPIEIELAVHVG